MRKQRILRITTRHEQSGWCHCKAWFQEVTIGQLTTMRCCDSSIASRTTSLCLHGMSKVKITLLVEIDGEVVRKEEVNSVEKAEEVLGRVERHDLKKYVITKTPSICNPSF